MERWKGGRVKGGRVKGGRVKEPFAFSNAPPSQILSYGHSDNIREIVSHLPKMCQVHDRKGPSGRVGRGGGGGVVMDVRASELRRLVNLDF